MTTTTTTAPLQGFPFTSVAEAVVPLGDHTGTVAAMGRKGEVASFASVAEAALSLGHRTYSGTVAATERQPN